MYNRLFVTLTIAALAAIGFAPAPASAETPHLIQRLSDAPTGTVVQVLRQSPWDLTIIATGPVVTVERRMLDGRVITTLNSRGHHVSITPGGGKTTVRLDGRTIVVSARDQEAGALARNALADSPVVADAIDLLGRLSLPAEQPVASMLQLTRASLMGASGDAAGAIVVMQGMRAELTHATMAVKASYSMESSCWTDYEKEAIAAADDFVECMNDIPWYDFWDPESCKAIYDMQAIGAFTEWASCVALWNMK